MVLSIVVVEVKETFRLLLNSCLKFLELLRERELIVRIALSLKS